MSTVKVKRTRNGKVLNISTQNPNEAWVMVEMVSEDYQGGRRWENKRLGFLRGTTETLSNLNLKSEFAKYGSELPVLQATGFAENQLLPGRVVIQDQLKPIMEKNPEFGKRIPQIAPKGTKKEDLTRVMGIIRSACTASGLTYKQSGLTIYRKVFYSPYPEGHARYEADVILSPDNLDAVTNFIAKLDLGNVPVASVDKAARLKELKAIKKNDRTPEQVSELADLMED